MIHILGVPTRFFVSKDPKLNRVLRGLVDPGNQTRTWGYCNPDRISASSAPTNCST